MSSDCSNLPGVSARLLVGLEAEKMQTVTYVDAWYWRCEECGWLGTRHFSQSMAIKEAGDHWVKDHGWPAPVVTRQDVRASDPDQAQA